MSGVHVDQFSVRTGFDGRSAFPVASGEAYVQTAGLFSGVSRDTKTFGTKLDGKSLSQLTTW